MKYTLGAVDELRSLNAACLTVENLFNESRIATETSTTVVAGEASMLW